MVRSSHQLSKQISDLIRQPSVGWVPWLFIWRPDFFVLQLDGWMCSIGCSLDYIYSNMWLFFLFCVNSPQPAKEDVTTPLPAEKTPTSVNQTPVETNEFPQLPEGLEKKPIVLKFSAMIDGIAIGAALLPSLKAEYKMGRMRSHGMTGNLVPWNFIKVK